MRRYLAVSLLMLLAAAGSAFAGTEARIQGKVLDAASRQPIKDAVVALESTEKMTVKQNAKTKADGSFALFVLDGTIRYQLTVSAAGYDTHQETVKLSIGVSEAKDFVLTKAGTAPASAAAAAKPDPTVMAYNDGAALANAGDIDGAIKKFEEAVAAKPDLLAGWMALAKMQLRQKNYPKAIEAAGKVLEIDDSDADMLTVQYQAYLAQGDKANAAKIEPKLPKNAGALFNDAAKRINSGDDAGAETLLQQAIVADEKFAQAHYELGMIYVRAGKTGDAKPELLKFIELSGPVVSSTEIETKCKTEGNTTECISRLKKIGEDVNTAKEMMKYLK